MTQGLYEQVQEAVAAVRARAPGPPEVAVILGSGLGPFADGLKEAVAIPFVGIPHFRAASVAGHAGRLVLGTLGGARIAALQGRIHTYEGFPADLAAFPARVLCALGARVLVVTNAAGGVNPEFTPGDLMRITDHLNLSGRNPLTGENDARLGPRFPDLTHAYDPALGDQLELTARELGEPVRRGVYAMMAGPSYETPAEIRLVRALGGDAVGMSTVPEVIVAAHQGVPVVGISCITNMAAGITGAKLTHDEVTETAERVQARFVRLLAAFLPRAARAVSGAGGAH
jgi:purine-nucleoside phosphorylase